jgi:hypothetical protein
MRMNFKRSAFRYGMKKYIIKNRFNNKSRNLQVTTPRNNSENVSAGCLLVTVAAIIIFIVLVMASMHNG